MINRKGFVISLMALTWLLMGNSCRDSHPIIVPETGYDWPGVERHYWPTDDWETAKMNNHNMDAEKMSLQWAGASAMFELAYFRCEGVFPTQYQVDQFRSDYLNSPASVRAEMATLAYWLLDADAAQDGGPRA